MNQNYVSELITTHIPLKRKVTPGGINFNCPLCVLRGQSRPDNRMRCGVKIFSNGAMKINCFNCKLATKWDPGDYLPAKIKQLLKELGCSDKEVLFAHKVCYQLANSLMPAQRAVVESYTPEFNSVELTEGAKPLSYWDNLIDNDISFPNQDHFLNVQEYALSRGKELYHRYSYYWSPVFPHHKRLIIPFLHKNEIVGYVGRTYDPNDMNRYMANTQVNYIFNNHYINDYRKIVIVVEGVFDAMSIDGAAMLGAKMTDSQALWLKDSGKKVIILPDLQPSGMPLVDAATKHGFMVSIPEWEYGIKDANQAVEYYGKLWTIKSIIDNATNNKMKINFLSKKLMVN